MKNSDIIVFDTETTGLIAPSPTNIERQPYITEVYFLKLNSKLEKIDELETMMLPPIPISEEITKITGIVQADVDGQPPFIKKYDEIYDFFEGVNYVVGHNLKFDMDVLYYELFRHDFQNKFHFPKTWICTIEKSMHYKNKRLTLSKLYEHLFGTTFEGAHRAKVDVEATARCFIEMCKRGDINV